MRSRTRSVLAALVLLVLAMGWPTPAAAHQRLLRSEPAREATLNVAPRELRLVFNEPVTLAFTRLELLGPQGTPVALGELRTAPDSTQVLIAPITGPLRAGGYAVRWQTASQDGHPVRGEFTFSIVPDAGGLTLEPPASEAAGGDPAPGQGSTPAEHHPTTGLSPEGGFSAESPAYVGVRWLTFAAIIGIVGAVAFGLLVLGLVRRRDPSEAAALLEPARRRAAGVGFALTALLLLATLARLYAQSLAMHGGEGALDPELMGTVLRRTIWGWGWILQLGATLLAGVGLLLARRGTPAGWGLAAFAALALALTPALSGHAAAMEGTIGTAAVLADALHVLGAGGWLGSLLVLLLAGIPAAMQLGVGRRGAGVAALVRAFSPTALLFAGLLVLTGVFATIIHSGSLAALLASEYGRLLFLKLGIFLLVFGTGAYNYLRVQPALGDDSATRRLRRSAGFELAVGAAVLLVTAVLVATARPFEVHDQETAVESTEHAIPATSTL
ncbi:MAG TPA: copper resistance protein CopC [Longimicrobiaceae bacterium]|nr:copper resistance protein CopC [Longimicrobiaceae bacterium]